MMSSSLAGRSARSARGAIGASWSIAAEITALVAPENAERPVAISYITRPNEKRSVRGSSASPGNCSGDM
jgi:hypothetical protein